MTRRTACALVAAALAISGAATLLGPIRAVATGPTVTSLTFNDTNGQFAPQGHLGSNQLTTVVLTAKNGNSTVAGATVYLAATGRGTASVTNQCGAGTVSLTGSPVACTASTNGTVSISVRAPGTIPAGGIETISATDAQPTPTITTRTEYFWGPVDSLSWNVAPIAAPGSAGSTPTVIKVHAASSGADVSAFPMWLSFTSGGGAGTAIAISGTASGAIGTPCSTSSTPAGTQPGPTTLGTSPVEVTTGTDGYVSVCYSKPLTNGTTDTVTAQDDNTFPGIIVRDGYNTQSQTLDHYTLSPSAIASSGSLQPGGKVAVTVTAYSDAAGNTPIPYIALYLVLNSTASPAGSASGTSSTAQGPAPVTSTPQVFVTDGTGTVPVSYQASSATAGGDTITAQNAPSSPTKFTDDSYTYDTATQLIFSPNPMGTAGTPPSGATVTLVAEDAGNVPVPGTAVNLTFSPAGSGTTSPTATYNGQQLPLPSAQPLVAQTDAGGHISLQYSANDGTGGRDIINAQSVTTPSLVAQDSYQYAATPTAYAVSPTPVIAPPGSLNPNDIVPVVFTARDGSNHPISGGRVYMTFTGNMGTAGSSACSPSTLSSSPSTCTTDTSGQVTVNYVMPNSVPTSGTATINAADAQNNATSSLADSYTAVGGYAFVPGPQVAQTGSLTSSQVVPVTLTVTDGTSTALPSARVWLSFAPASGSTATMTANSTPLTSTPTEFTADGSGHVALSYTRSAAAPAGGSDVVTAQNAATSPNVSGADSYSYVAQFALAPAGPKIAPDGSLAASTLRIITITAQDDHGAAAPGAKVAVKFVHTTGGGSATSSECPALSSSPVICTADGSGRVVVNYTTPATLPTSGTDTITAANDTGTSPTLSVTDSYTFTAPPPPPPPAKTIGYWMVASDGGIFSFGSAQKHFHGSEGGKPLNAPIVGMAPMPDGDGYFLVASDGGIFTFGSASQHFHGSEGGKPLNAPIVGMALMPDGDGYFLVASDGGIFTFGSASQHFHGSEGGKPLNKPIVGMAVMPDGDGYFLVASDGGIFTFGSASQHFHGSEGGKPLNAPIVGMAMMPDGDGYFMVATDGGIFTFGSAASHFLGSEGGKPLNKPVVGMAVITA